MQRLNNEVCMIRDAHQAFEKSQAYEELPEEQELRREAAEEQAEDTKARMDADDTDVEDREDVTSVDDENEIDVAPAETTTSEHTNTQASARNRNIETKPQTSPQSFTEISEDIERFLRRNHSSKGSFTAQV